MRSLLTSIVTALALTRASVFAQDQIPVDIEEDLEDPSQSSVLNVKIDTVFGSDSDTLFGIKLVNGRPSDIKLSIHNSEPEPVQVAFVGGSLWTPEKPNMAGSIVLRNLTAKQYGTTIPAGESETIPYTFVTNMHPQDVRLSLSAVIAKGNTYYTQQAYNSTISITEPPMSLFDPQTWFLYIFILATVAGVGYFFYTIWVVPYFPALQQKKRGKNARSQVKKIDAGSQKSGDEGPTSATGASKYAEEWIPSHHLQRPEAKRVKSGGAKRTPKA